MSIRASKRIKQEISLSLPIGVDKDGNEISFNDILGTDTDEIVDSIDLKIQVGNLRNALKEALTEREQTVIISRYGLDGQRAQTAARNCKGSEYKPFLCFTHREKGSR